MDDSEFIDEVIESLVDSLSDLGIGRDYIETAVCDFYDSAIDVFYSVNKKNGIDERPTSISIATLICQRIFGELINSGEAILCDNGIVLTDKWHNGIE